MCSFGKLTGARFRGILVLDRSIPVEGSDVLHDAAVPPIEFSESYCVRVVDLMLLLRARDGFLGPGNYICIQAS